MTYDAREDERFRSNPFVTGDLGNVRFYASHPLTSPEGVTVGTLCVFDEKPRHLDIDQAGMISTLAGRVMDVLELELRSRQLESTVGELQAARVRLESSNERLAAFAGQVSHDLKNPLTALELSLGLMEEEVEDLGVLDGALGQLLARASRGATRMEAMINELLDFARLGGNPELVDVDLDPVVAEAVADVDGALDGGAVTVHDLPDRARRRHPAARGDPEPARQRREVHGRRASSRRSRCPAPGWGTSGGSRSPTAAAASPRSTASGSSSRWRASTSPSPATGSGWPPAGGSSPRTAAPSGWTPGRAAARSPGSSSRSPRPSD